MSSTEKLNCVLTLVRYRCLLVVHKYQLECQVGGIVQQKMYLQLSMNWSYLGSFQKH